MVDLDVAAQHQEQVTRRDVMKWHSQRPIEIWPKSSRDYFRRHKRLTAKASSHDRRADQMVELVQVQRWIDEAEDRRPIIRLADLRFYVGIECVLLFLCAGQIDKLFRLRSIG